MAIRNRPLRILKSERGVALLIALFAMVLLTFIAVEVSYDTSVDYIVAAQQVNRIKAYYAAKSGVELSLLRVMLYKQAMASFGSSLGPQKSMLDPIWNFPFMWPPTLMKADGATEVDKDLMKEVTTESLMESQYSATIEAMSGRLDINGLASPVKALQKATMVQLQKIFQSEIDHNEKFQKKYSGYNFTELINNIADYVDDDSESLNGGDESRPYADIEDHDIKLPPNRAFRTLDELHQVAGMKDDFYNVLAPRVTIYGSMGININYAGKDMLMALDPSMTEDAVKHIIERRNDPNLGGPFHDENDFFGFARNYGVDVNSIQKSGIPILTDMEYNFKITSTGISANVKREITVITYDYPNLAQRLADLLNKQQNPNPQSQPPPDKNPDPTKTGNPANPTPTGTAEKIQAPTGRPTVVYWQEN